MSNKMAPFMEVLEDSHAWITKYKADTGAKVAGFFCDYVPEEVLYAAGFVTVRITGGQGNVMSADKYLQSNVCSFSRRCFDQALEGVYGYLDALVVPHTCDVITKIYDLWAYRMKDPAFAHYIWVPHKVFDKAAVPLMEGEIKRLKTCTEEYIGQEISDAALEDAIKLYNRSRSLLKRVYQLRQASPPLISGFDATAVALSSLLTPKDLHNQWMEDLLAEYEGKPSSLPERPRIMVSASMLDDLSLIKTIEDAGAWVVADDICSGSRYFWDLVEDSGGKPLSALTQRYLNKLPCPRSVGSMDPREEHLQSLGRDYGVDGVIFYILRCCDAHQFQYPRLSQHLEQAGYKLLYIQGDQTVGVNEQVANRIQAFTEILSS